MKIITTAEGGLVTTNNTKLAKKMTELRSHGITKNPDNFEGIDCGPWHYEQQGLGFNYRMTDIQAGLGISQLNRLDSIVEERNRLFKIYMSRLDSNHLDLLKIPTDVYSSLHLAVVVLKRDDREYHRKILEAETRNWGSTTLRACTSTAVLQKMGFKHGNFPKAEAYARKVPVPSISRAKARRTGIRNRYSSRVTKNMKPAISLGTAQFGLNYGITNEREK